MRNPSLANTLNEAFIHRLTIEVYQDGDLIGAGLIVQHTKLFIKLNDGMHYFKQGCDFKVKTEDVS